MTKLLDALVAALLNMTFMQWALIVGGLFMLSLVMRAQLDDSDAFDLRHLIANQETGKIDRYSFAFMLGCTTLTWAFVYYAWSNKPIDTWGFLAYGLMMMFPEVVKQIAAPIIARRFGIEIPAPPATPPGALTNGL